MLTIYDLYWWLVRDSAIADDLPSSKYTESPLEPWKRKYQSWISTSLWTSTIIITLRIQILNVFEHGMNYQTFITVYRMQLANSPGTLKTQNSLQRQEKNLNPYYLKALNRQCLRSGLCWPGRFCAVFIKTKLVTHSLPPCKLSFIRINPTLKWDQFLSFKADLYWQEGHNILFVSLASVSIPCKYLLVPHLIIYIFFANS